MGASKSLKSHELCVILIFTLTHCGILFLFYSVYWDDWIIYRAAPDVVLDIFNQAGSPFNLAGRFHGLLIRVGPGSYKFIVFFSMLGTGIALNSIIRRHESINDEARIFMVLLFLILPFNLARPALINTISIFCYFCFFVAWAVINKYRIAALVLFLVSFNVNSLLVFFSLPFFEGYFKCRRAGSQLKSFINYSFRRLDFVLLPFLFYGIKCYYFKPYGHYKGYNEGFSLGWLIKAPLLMAVDWMRLEIPVLPLCIAFLFILRLSRRYFDLSMMAFSGSARAWISVSIATFFLGAFPYWLLGLVPAFEEWSSRHQILLPLGTAIGLTFLTSKLRAQYRILSTSFLVATSVLLNIQSYADFYLDWQKQKSIMAVLSGSNEIRWADLVIFDDHSWQLNAIGRTYRPYEWNGIMESAFGDQSRFGINSSDLVALIDGSSPCDMFSYGEEWKSKGFGINGILRVVVVEIYKADNEFKSLLRGNNIIHMKINDIFDAAMDQSTIKSCKLHKLQSLTPIR